MLTSKFFLTQKSPENDVPEVDFLTDENNDIENLDWRDPKNRGKFEKHKRRLSRLDSPISVGNYDFYYRLNIYVTFFIRRKSAFSFYLGSGDR